MLENAKFSVLSSLMPVLDDLDRAREHGELTGGFKAVAEALERIVAAQGLVKFGAPGDEFDPRLHEALMHSHSADVTTTTCENIVTAGYQIGERVVRPARVTVVDPEPPAVRRRRRVGPRPEPATYHHHHSSTAHGKGGGRMTNADWANKDFYKVLGVAKDAPADEIKKAYRKLARANHPDSRPGDKAAEERFKAIAEAYDVVGDDEKRKQYDEMRSAVRRRLRTVHHHRSTRCGAASTSTTSSATAEAAAVRAAAASATSSAPCSVAQAAGSAAHRTQAATRRRHRDRGDHRLRRLHRRGHGLAAADLRRAVPRLLGHRSQAGTVPRVCPDCDGVGMRAASVGGAFTMNETCPACGGRGLVVDDPCPTCHGSGRGLSNRTISARIPAGVKDGQRIRLRGKGASGERGGPAGDLYVTVKVAAAPALRPTRRQPHPRRPGLLRRGRARRRHQGADARRCPGDRQDPARAPRTAAPSGCAARAPPRKDGHRGDLLVTVEVQVPAAPRRRGPQPPWRPTASDRAGADLRSKLFEDGATMSTPGAVAGTSRVRTCPSTSSASPRELTGPAPADACAAMTGSAWSSRAAPAAADAATPGATSSCSARSPLTATGIGLEGVRRILELEHTTDALRHRVGELEAELARRSPALRATLDERTDAQPACGRAPAPPSPSPSGAVPRTSDPTMPPMSDVPPGS